MHGSLPASTDEERTDLPAKELLSYELTMLAQAVARTFEQPFRAGLAAVGGAVLTAIATLVLAGETVTLATISRLVLPTLVTRNSSTRSFEPGVTVIVPASWETTVKSTLLSTAKVVGPGRAAWSA